MDVKRNRACAMTYLRLWYRGVLGLHGHHAAACVARGRGASVPQRRAKPVASPAELRRRARPLRGVVARRGKVPATGGGREAHRGRRHGSRESFNFQTQLNVCFT